MRDDKRREYEAPGIVITWEPHLCQHAKECVRGLPMVFNSRERPWIRPEGASVEEIVTVIDRCPSYALGYRTDDGRVRVPPSDSATAPGDAQPPPAKERHTSSM